MHTLSDAEFTHEIRLLEGTPEAVLDNPELMDFLLPVLRADFHACDTYQYIQEAPLDCPFLMYGGTEDREVGKADLEKWREHTTGPFTITMMAGNHFFVQTQRDALLNEITRSLTPPIGQAPRHGA
jgi:surfactin synthase thioesterase subunit